MSNYISWEFKEDCMFHDTTKIWDENDSRIEHLCNWRNNSGCHNTCSYFSKEIELIFDKEEKEETN